MSDDLYQEQIIELALHPLHKGQLEDPDITVKETNASCGDEVTVDIKFTDPNDSLSPIKVLKWHGSGCIISQASMSALAEYMQGRTLSEIHNLTQQQLEKWLGISDISIGRMKCLFVGLNTLRKAKT